MVTSYLNLVTIVFAVGAIAGAGACSSGGSGELDSVSDGGSVGSDGGSGGDSGKLASDASPSDAHLDEAGHRCVTVDPASYDGHAACNADSDCAAILTGEWCDGQCGCGANLAINKSELPKYNATISGILSMACPCMAGAQAACIAHVCTLCQFGGGGVCGDR